MEIATQQPAETCVTRAWRVHQAEIEGDLRHRLREGRRFCELREPRAWLFAVARNALADHLRLRHVAEPLPEELQAPQDQAEPVDTLADCLPVALAALDLDDRDVLSRCDLQGMTQKEYAKQHGLTLPAVKSRVLRARTRLRLLLVERCGVRFDAATGRVCCRVPRQPISASRSTSTTAA